MSTLADQILERLARAESEASRLRAEVKQLRGEIRAMETETEILRQCFAKERISVWVEDPAPSEPSYGIGLRFGASIVLNDLIFDHPRRRLAEVEAVLHRKLPEMLCYSLLNNKGVRVPLAKTLGVDL